MKVMMIFVTFPNLDVAREVGTVIIERKLVACVNLLPNVESIYRWEGKICSENEVLGVFKVCEENYSKFEEVVVNLHPYDVPEVLAVNVENGFEQYLNWVKGGV